MEQNNSVTTISAQALQKKMTIEPDLVVINVLDKKYYDDCSIKKSINIPLEQLVETTASWEKNKELVVYCASITCPKSEQAYHILQDLGFVHLFEYKEGITDWLQKGYETSGSCSLEYLHKQ